VVDLANAAAVALLTRAPSAGGKSRLFAALRRPPDPDLLAALLLDTLEAAAHPGVPVVVFVEPADRCDEVRALVAGAGVMPQAGGTLGERMAAAMAALFDAGARAVAVVGSDIPDLPPGAVAHAFAALARDPQAVVLGPARDGGYYLVAATRVPPLFDGIAWGTDQVFEQTLALAATRGVRIEQTPLAADVDSPDELWRVAAARTRAWADRHRPLPGQYGG
jgi:rSAM/selenodomain-associated transferase 1